VASATSKKSEYGRYWIVYASTDLCGRVGLTRRWDGFSTARLTKAKAGALALAAVKCSALRARGSFS
jgi:hypothetical protein